MENIKFEDYKQKIIEKLKEKRNLRISEDVILLDGFVNFPIQQEISWNLIIWWPSIPCIVLVWKETGRLYFFAFKNLFPNI